MPTFDVVVIEPNGEGVIAGRAAPGWQVSVQSGGTKVAEAKADLQGEWSVVLEKPLPAGDHALSLKITSPDGTRALSSQESVRVAVGADAKKASAPAGVEGLPRPRRRRPMQSRPCPHRKPPRRRPFRLRLPRRTPLRRVGMRKSPAPTKRRLPRKGLARRRAAKRPRPRLGRHWCSRRPTMWIRVRGPAPSTLSGIADPGAKISIFSDNALIAEARADRDGSWRVVVQKKLGMGQHSFRAEQAGAGAGTLAHTAMVTIERVEPKPEPPKAQPSRHRPRRSPSLRRLRQSLPPKRRKAPGPTSSAKATPYGPSPSAISAAGCAIPRSSRITAR